MQKLCTALVLGNGGNECRKPVVEDANIALCALHLLLAAQEVTALGEPTLIELAQKDAGRTAGANNAKDQHNA